MIFCRDQWKIWLCLLCAVALLFTGTPASAYAPVVTMSVTDANLGVVLAEVARMGNANIVINVKPADTVTVTFDRVPFETALYYIARTKGLSIDKKNGNTYIVTSPEEMAKGFQEVKVFPLKFARADHIKNIIVGGGKSDSEFAVENPGASKATEAGTLSTSGSGSGGSGAASGSSGGTTSSANKEGIKGLVLNTDASTNSIIAFGTPDQIHTVAQLLKELDVPYQQILLEAQVVALSKNASKELGIDWSWSEFGASRPQGTTTRYSDGSSIYTAAQTTSFPIFTVTGKTGLLYDMGVNAKINALITNGEGKLLARPNVLTFNGNKATIFVGDQLPVITPNSDASSGKITYTTDYKNAGITLSYVPRINDNDQIAANVFVEVSTPSTVTLNVGGQKTDAYQITTRSAQTNVRMKDGDTLVIGGLISSIEAKSLNKVPLLGDLPILGQFFRNLSKSKTESEVVIFLKAKVLK
ncbi:MAG: type II secretion system protein GspD [Veillonellaceae bacterium]|nr:type II secretion system protein GspD [Veillonellaceae bacterium]